MEPIHDLLVFDWVLALGSTKDAAELLGLPQSSVSRRYRALAERFGISMRRKHGELFVSDSGTTLRLLRELSQHFRIEKQVYRWCWQPELLPLLQQLGHIGAGSTFLKLDPPQWQRRAAFLQSPILDLSFEICCDLDVPWVGMVNLGIHLHIPPAHPLLALPETERLEAARAYPLKTPNFSLPDELTSNLRRDGFQLTVATQRVDDVALDLKPCPPPDIVSLGLPYALMGGWRIEPLLHETVFSPTSLEQCVAPLHHPYPT